MLYVDGILISALPGDSSSGGAFVQDGFTIAANDNGGERTARHEDDPVVI